MSDKKFYIQKYKRNSSGSWVADGTKKSLEDDFGFCRYLSLSGMNARGKQKNVYEETYVESDAARVWFADTAAREQPKITLSLVFFGDDPQLSSSKSDAELTLAAEKSWNEFYDWIEGGLLEWYDDYRQRKMLLYMTEACAPKADVVKGVPYLKCDVSLLSVFGKSLNKDSTTINEYLGIE